VKNDLLQGAKRVAGILRDAGHQAYFAGGCVRDDLLGRVPKDYDIVSDARPEQVVALFRRTIEVGAAFGVVKVLMGHDRDYEVATFRTEGTYTDGRRPDEVVYSDDWLEDVARRDFTINALLMDPVSGNILDAVEGREDLAAGLIRAVGTAERRFAEDKLRMLRAVRFAARFGFEIEAGTRRAIEQHAGELSGVSKERIVAELEGIFRGRAGHGFEQLAALGLLSPALAYVQGDAQPALVERMQRFEKLCERLNEGAARMVAWTLTIDGLSRKAAEAALRGMKLSREVIRSALYLLDALGEFSTDSDNPQEAVGPFSSELEAVNEPSIASPERAGIMRLAANSEASMTEVFFAVHQGDDGTIVRRFRRARADLAARPLPPRPLVTGGDLQTLGMRPGRAFKDILRAVDDAVLERRVTTRDEGLAWVQRYLTAG